MQQNQTSKVVFVSGGARRVGKAIVQTLHEHGYNIILHYLHSEAEAFEVAYQCNKVRQDSVHLFNADFSKIAECTDELIKLIDKIGRLDGLVNNASIFYPTPMDELTIEQMDRFWKINVMAPMHLSQIVRPYLSKTNGCIVNIADEKSMKPRKDYPAYSVSKGALISLTHVLAIEYAPEIRVNAVLPGSVIWPENKNELTEKQKEVIINKTLLKKHGSPYDIATAVEYLLTASFVTDELLTVNGGITT